MRKSPTLLLIAAAIGFTTLFAGGSSLAQAPESPPRAPAAPQALPPELKVPAYPPGPMPFADGERLTYQASWIGIPAATARIQLDRNQKDPALWNAQVWLETSRGVDVIYKMRDYVVENIRRDSYQPQKMYIRQRENQRQNDFHVTFDRQSGVVTMEKKNRKSQQIRQFLSSNPWGPLSGSIMALSQPMRPGDRYDFDVFTGQNRYVFDFHVLGRERITTPLGTFDAIRISPWVAYLSDGNIRNQARETTIWISADKRHLPLRAEAQAFIGTVRADLVRIEAPAGNAQKAGVSTKGGGSPS